MVPISIRMHKIESRETSNRKYLSKTILACRERQAKKKAGKLQTGNTFPKQYWLAVNGKPKTDRRINMLTNYSVYIGFNH